VKNFKEKVKKKLCVNFVQEYISNRIMLKVYLEYIIQSFYIKPTSIIEQTEILTNEFERVVNINLKNLFLGNCSYKIYII